MRSYSLYILFFFTAVITAGCSSNPYGDSYGVADTREIQQVSYGEIVKLSPVTIQGQGSGVGMLAGAVVGGILGSKVGGGRGSDIAAVGGAVIGGAAGNKVGEEVSKADGVNIVIKLDSGGTIAIVQEVDPKMLFQVGQRVEVLTQGNTARVVPE